LFIAISAYDIVLILRGLYSS